MDKEMAINMLCGLECLPLGPSFPLFLLRFLYTQSNWSNQKYPGGGVRNVVIENNLITINVYSSYAQSTSKTLIEIVSYLRTSIY